MIKQPYGDKILEEHLSKIDKDGMTVFIMADGRFRGAFFNGTRMINQMRANHNLGLLETMVLGQAMLCGALMIPMMKGKEHVTFRYDTNGPAAGFSVEADSTGYVRGYIFQDRIPIDKPLENWDLAPFFGDGTVTVIRNIEGEKAPHTGSTEIKYRNIAQDLTWYFHQSEQVDTAFNTGIKFDKEGRIVGAGGLFLQKVADEGGINAPASKEETEDLLVRAERAFSAMPSIGQWFADGGNRRDVIYGLFREFEPKAVLERDIIFDCPCSAAGYVEAIKKLGKAELDDILANDPDPIVISCKNCGTVYKIPKMLLR